MGMVMMGGPMPVGVIMGVGVPVPVRVLMIMVMVIMGVVIVVVIVIMFVPGVQNPDAVLFAAAAAGSTHILEYYRLDYFQGLYPEFLPLYYRFQIALATRAGVVQVPDIKGCTAIHALRLTLDYVYPLLGCFQHCVFDRSRPDKIKGLELDSGQGADLQLDYFDLARPGLTDLVFGNPDNAQGNRQFVHGVQALRMISNIFNITGFLSGKP